MRGRLSRVCNYPDAGAASLLPLAAPVPVLERYEPGRYLVRSAMEAFSKPTAYAVLWMPKLPSSFTNW